MSTCLSTNEKKRDQQNFNMISQSVASNKCIRDLISKGITVLSIKIESGCPEIWVQNSKTCNSLNGVQTVRRNGPNGREIEKVAPIHECRVKWTEKGY